MKMGFHIKNIIRSFVLVFLLREICVKPLIMTRFTEGFLGFASLKKASDSTVLGATVVAGLTKFLEDSEDPNMKGNLR